MKTLEKEKNIAPSLDIYKMHHQSNLSAECWEKNKEFNFSRNLNILQMICKTLIDYFAQTHKNLNN